ncbi:MAG TPA: hypothetical protein VH703_00690 [Solirubrobacterales bacterium]|jgi:hypothetical protein
MSPLRTAPLLTATIALLACPALAGAQYVVPSGNSAVNQYTETVPTAGGGRDSEGGGKGAAKRSPAHVLGSRNAQRLDAQGAAGRATAEAAAATAPVETTVAPSTDAESGRSTAPKPGDRGKRRDGAGGSGAGGETPAAEQVAVELPAGSSGLGEVIAQATGSTSTGQTGLLLPLVLIAALAWAAGYYWRQRQSVG